MWHKSRALHLHHDVKTGTPIATPAAVSIAEDVLSHTGVGKCLSKKLDAMRAAHRPRSAQQISFSLAEPSSLAPFRDRLMPKSRSFATQALAVVGVDRRAKDLFARSAC